MASAERPAGQRGLTGSGAIAILGAGSLGRLWGALLPPERTGFIHRSTRPAPPGLEYRLRDLDGETHRICRRWLRGSLTPVRLLLVMTKAGQTLPALEAVMDELPAPCPVVLFQNGMGSQQAVARRWPDRPILAATTTEAANRPTPNEVVHAARGQTWTGALTGAAEPFTGFVVRELAQSGLAVQGEDRILERLWDKLVVNAGINPFTAILDCRNGDILTAPLFTAHIDGLCQELETLMQGEGRTPPSAGELRQRIEHVARATARNSSSMREDIRNRRPSEIDYINGYVARRSRELGLEAPVNQMLTDGVKELVSHP